MERILAARQDGLHKEGTKGERGKSYSHCPIQPIPVRMKTVLGFEKACRARNCEIGDFLD